MIAKLIVSGKFWLVSLFVVSVMACTPEPLEVTGIPALQPHIVVSTQVIPNQSMVVFLTRSIGALDAGRSTDLQGLLNQIVVQDATVTISDDNTVYTLTNLGNGLYGNQNIPVSPNHFYTLEANSQSLGKVISTTQAQKFIPFLNVTATLNEQEFDSLAVVKYSLQDPAEKNFYMVNIQKFSTTQDASSLLNPKLFTHVIQDDDFNGETFEEEFTAVFQHYSKGDTVAVSLTNISEAYYQYVKVRIDNRFSVASFATEPFNYPTNVEDGYGFFVIHQPDVRIFVLE